MTDILHLHPSSDLLEQYAMNRLAERQIGYVEEHLLLCGACCEALTAVEEEIRMMRLVLGGPNPAAHACRL